jgi:hypothetical protein
MTRGSVVAGSGVLLSVSGLILLGMAGNATLLGLFGGQVLAAPHAGDAAWVGVGFTRVCGAAIASLGLLMMAASRLPDAAAKAFGGPMFVAMALVTLVTTIQAQAIWSTLASWVLPAVLVFGCIGALQLVRHGTA